MTSASPADMTSWHLQNQLDQRAAEQVVKTKRTEQITLPSNMDLIGITSYGKQAKQTLQLCSQLAQKRIQRRPCQQWPTSFGPALKRLNVKRIRQYTSTHEKKKKALLMEPFPSDTARSTSNCKGKLPRLARCLINVKKNEGRRRSRLKGTTAPKTLPRQTSFPFLLQPLLFPSRNTAQNDSSKLDIQIRHKLVIF